jgi:hypothetical protein
VFARIAMFFYEKTLWRKALHTQADRLVYNKTF